MAPYACLGEHALDERPKLITERLMQVGIVRGIAYFNISYNKKCDVRVGSSIHDLLLTVIQFVWYRSSELNLIRLETKLSLE